jgi:hypothetical protein
MIWRALSLYTNSESPIVVVLRYVLRKMGSKEDMISLYSINSSIIAGVWSLHLIEGICYFSIIDSHLSMLAIFVSLKSKGETFPLFTVSLKHIGKG